MSNEVRDNLARNRFELALDGGMGFITYRRAPGVIDLLHAEVPPELKGRGHGSALVKGVLDLIRMEGLKVHPRCPFVDAYMHRHREYDDLRGRGQT